MIPSVNQEIRLKSHPDGMPTEENFELVEVPTPRPQKGEILVQNEWMSVDPWMRVRMRPGNTSMIPFEVGQPLEGPCLGRVIESHSEDFAEGEYVLANLGWRNFWTAPVKNVEAIATGNVPIQTHLGVLGTTGMTAFVGMMRIAELKEGDRVFVSAASGAVGSVACQIARIRNCYVVASTGSAANAEWLKANTSVDVAFDYHDAGCLSERLAEYFPEGIDVYFDNVGGNHLEAAIDNMRTFGRIVCCGMISSDNDDSVTAVPGNLSRIIDKSLRLQGFNVNDHMSERKEFLRVMVQWVEGKRVVWEETISEGLHRAPAAFIELFQGHKTGKSLVKL